MNYETKDLIALNNNVIVRLDKWDNVTATGLFLAKECEVTSCDGTIISVGKRVKESLKPGDRVRARQYAGQIFWINDDYEDKFVSIAEEEIDWVYL